MITYAARNGHYPFDWNAFLAKETHTDEEWENAKALSRQWVTCACGNQCENIPRHKDGSPRDATLNFLGKLFFLYISEYKLSAAKKALKDIEDRSAELLSQLNTTTS